MKHQQLCLCGGKLRTRLDLIKPDIRKHITDQQVSQDKSKVAIDSKLMYNNKYRGEEKWIKIIVRTCSDRIIILPDTGCPHSYLEKKLDKPLASDNRNMSNNTLDGEPAVRYTPPVSDENDFENEIAEEQNGVSELDQREEEAETKEQPGEILPHKQRYPGKFRQKPFGLGFNRLQEVLL